MEKFNFFVIRKRIFPVNALGRLLCSKTTSAVSIPKSLCQLTEELDQIEKNIQLRKHVNNVPYIRELLIQLCKDEHNPLLKSKLTSEILKLPNETHPRVQDYVKPKELEGFFPDAYTKSTYDFLLLSKLANICRMDHLGNYTGHKSYYLFGNLAEMEHAIKEYTIMELRKNNFRLLSVPDILPKDTIEACGMRTDSERTQVYKLDSGLCLSGTSEMALAGFFANRLLEESELPIKVAAVSRCYRAETSGLNEEKGIYRVHQFTKVEMFSVCSETQSEEMLDLFKNLQLQIFKKLKLKFRLLDMPPEELGAPAYEKYDIEAWMPGKNLWGEISSCSNCTDYQSKRLNIKYASHNKQMKYAHTVNGTSAAIPRLLISLIETNQVGRDQAEIPGVIADYMSNSKITKDKRIPEMKLVKNIKYILEK